MPHLRLCSLGLNPAFPPLWASWRTSPCLSLPICQARVGKPLPRAGLSGIVNELSKALRWCLAGDACFRALIVYREAPELAPAIFFQASRRNAERGSPPPPILASSYLGEAEAGACGPPGGRDDGENVLSPPLLRATKYVHAVRCLVNGHPGRPSPGQTWGSPANFRNDLSAQLLPSHWRRGRVWGGRGGAGREGDVGGGVPDISPSPLPSGLGGVSALPAGEISRARVVPVTRGLVRRKVPWDQVLRWAPCEPLGIIFQNVLLGAGAAAGVGVSPAARPPIARTGHSQSTGLSWKDLRAKCWGERTLLRVPLACRAPAVGWSFLKIHWGSGYPAAGMLADTCSGVRVPLHCQRFLPGVPVSAPRSPRLGLGAGLVLQGACALGEGTPSGQRLAFPAVLT